MPEPQTQTHPEELTALSLLRDVRDVMNTSGEVQHRLDNLVALIAHHFHSEVCSVYLLQSNQLLELFATAGLNPEAIHQTRLKVGEGLVGEIAADGKPLNLADAPAHPKFSHRPETGEELYQSFVGVPILARHQTVGTLVVQRTKSELYTEEQLEILQTVAMLLAEMVVGNQLVNPHTLALDRRSNTHSHAIAGQKLCAGLAKAQAVLHRPEIEILELVANNPEREEKRLSDAIETMRRQVDELIDSSGVGGDGEHAEILETYRMFAHDKGWVGSMMQNVRSGLTAEAAVKKAMEELHVRMDNIANQYIRQRAEDLEDLSTRLLCQLAGVSHTAAHGSLPDRFILVARSLGPAELLEYGHERIAGLVLEKGSSASHIAVIARMMDIPVVAGVSHAIEVIEPEDLVIVDGDHGEIYIRPAEDMEEEINLHLALKAEKNAAYAAMRDLPPLTWDGQRISLNLNIGLHIDAREVAADDVDGIGLYRTELPYLASPVFPDVEQQRQIYRETFRKAAGKPIIFRTFDVGGDKHVSYVQLPEEENPAMGWRATRIALDRPLLIRRQFCALLEAAQGEPLSIMFPMIATVEEFDAVRALLEVEVNLLQQRGSLVPSSLEVGVMLEIPSLIYELPALLPKIDFVSIGSNDLFQFFFAADRNNEQVAARYDPLRPSVLGMLRDVVQQCAAADVRLSFCGDMASNPLETMALLACGIRHLSVPVAAIGPIKAMIRSLDLTMVTRYVDNICHATHRSVRQHLQAFARDHSVVID